MSDRAFRNASKNRRVHRERSQPANRQKLGPLEKKKDYRLRAKKTHQKEDLIKKLKEKAALKNPDEFYFGMTTSQIKVCFHHTLLTNIKDGQCVKMEKPSKQNTKELIEMKTQDISYITMSKGRESAVCASLAYWTNLEENTKNGGQLTFHWGCNWKTHNFCRRRT